MSIHLVRAGFVRLSVGDDRTCGRIRGGLQRLAQPAKQRLHLLLVQHGRLHQQRAGSGWNQAQVMFDGQFDRILNESDADWLFFDRTVLWWGIHSHAARLQPFQRPRSEAVHSNTTLTSTRMSIVNQEINLLGLIINRTVPDSHFLPASERHARLMTK
ncbi:MAG: hypothetical protein H7Z14_04505 [Anaerolineae bacterium]|nr:hypothetical protein [Phycisphaerae bacterium]